MRDLTAKQKLLLKKWVKAGQNQGVARQMYGAGVSKIRKVEDLSQIQWEMLKAINDTEILYQEVNSYLWGL